MNGWAIFNGVRNGRAPHSKIVAADVSPLIIPAGKKFEPAHVGCYTFRMPQGQRGAWLAQ
jgi:hypothetical protein